MAKIVFCEDEEMLQKLIRLVFRSTAHEVHIASDGLEGFALIEREQPDLIFTDVSMPGYDGFQLADAIKARPRLASIPIIFVTAFAQRTDLEEGARHGATGYLLKPFTAADLREMVESAIVPDGRWCIGGSYEGGRSTEKH
jgi:CheY-like chemotaxis protein